MRALKGRDKRACPPRVVPPFQGLDFSFRVPRLRDFVACLGLCCFAPLGLFAQDKKDEPARVIAIAPLHLVAGEKATFRMRGMKLKEATEVRATPDAAATLKEKKDSTVPNGLEAGDVGNTEVSIELTPPAGCAKLTLELVTPAGTVQREVAVFPKDAMTAEKEPNNGFREAQQFNPAKPVLAKIDGDKDVDVFRFDARAAKPFTARVIAAGAGSLLDPFLSLYDLTGRLLASTDDTDAKRDPVLTFTPKTDGPLCLVITDAQDRGGAWHDYRLEVSQQQ